ncbi:nucleotidyl transferase AbiEii/AbiGii toxin family protein [candidate division WOR-3 bacterium]|nr:nucleotidyl transferase AbiEii/AbiGii toxin family protein [candidate division WOR-3 bacterium]
MIERSIVAGLARKLEIDEYSILREYIQMLFLRDFYGLSNGARVFFKGGTAIRLLLHSFGFSEGLDFTATLSKKSIKKMVQTTLEISRLEAPGLESEILSETANSLVHRIAFPTELSIHPLTIKLEFSFREKPLTRKVSVIETELPVSPYALVVHSDFEEILAEKILALLTRSQGRDIFDVWYLLSKGVPINRQFTRSKLSFYKKAFSINKLRESIEGVSTQSLRDDLERFLPRSHRAMIGELKGMLLQKIEGIA